MMMLQWLTRHYAVLHLHILLKQTKLPNRR